MAFTSSVILSSPLPIYSFLRFTKIRFHSISNPSFHFNTGIRRRRKEVNSFSSFCSCSMTSDPKESPSDNPGLLTTPPDEATRGYFMQQTMFRIKDPKVSLDFYSRVLGMSLLQLIQGMTSDETDEVSEAVKCQAWLLKRLDFPEMKFSLYFMGYENLATAPTDASARTAWTFAQKATIELTHNWGTESDSEFKGYHNGNSEPRGFGHIGITVDDTYKACDRFERLGVEFVKKPDDGKMKGIAFVKDPDGYWIEIFDLKHIATVTSTAA